MQMKNATLLSVLIFARHGDRTPSFQIDEDFWKTKLSKSSITTTLSSEGGESQIFSQLTSKGLLEMIKLGQDLQMSYPQFDSTQMKFYCTDYDRTKDSSKAVSQSFFSSPPCIIHFLPKNEDKFFDPWSSIPAFEVAVNNFFTINRNVEIEQIVRKFQISLNKPKLSLIEIYDIFICNESHHDAPPINIELEKFRELLKVETNLQYRALYCDLTIRKYAVGYLAKAIGNYFESQLRNSPTAPAASPFSYFDSKATFSFVACHDLNIIPLQKLFFEEQEDIFLTWPKYGYQLIFELYSNGMIKIFDSDLKLNKVLSMNDLLNLFSGVGDLVYHS